MEFSAALVTDLRTLLAPSGDPITDSLTALATDLKLAVRSYLGLQFTTHRLAQPITLTLFGSAATADDISTSFTLPLTAAAGEPTDTLTCFASTPGAFVDLAADLAYALHLPPGLVLIDQGLRPTTMTSGISGLAEVALIDRAIGVLTEQGHHPDDAHAELMRQARGKRLSVHAWASELLDRAAAGPQAAP